MFADV